MNSSTKSAATELKTAPQPTGDLIVCYGNPLRRDDGVAMHVFRQLEPRLEKTDEFVLELLYRFQLTPELAESMSQHERVLFVDATASGVPGEVRWTPLSPATCDAQHATEFTHRSTPSDIVALCQALYGYCPETSLLTISGASFEFGEFLTDPVAAALPGVVKTIVQWLDNSSPER